MWLILTAIVLIIGIIITHFAYKKCNDFLCIFGDFLTIAAGIALCIMITCVITAHTNVDAKIAENQAIYESLLYQIENDIYDNDNDLGKKELYDQVQKWNSDLAYRQKAQRNIWVGIFYPNIFDQFKFIEYPQLP